MRVCASSANTSSWGDWALFSPRLHQALTIGVFFLPTETKIKQLDPDDMDELEKLEN